VGAALGRVSRCLAVSSPHEKRPPVCGRAKTVTAQTRTSVALLRSSVVAVSRLPARQRRGSRRAKAPPAHVVEGIAGTQRRGVLLPTLTLCSLVRFPRPRIPTRTAVRSFVRCHVPLPPASALHPAAKKRRRLNRIERAQKIGPRPAAGPLRPVVRCQTSKHNLRVRSGRGFTLAELKAAGVNRRTARGIGIAVDYRRVNRSVEGLQANVERLQHHLAHLVVFPRRKGKPTKGDSSAEDLAAATQFKGTLQPIKQDTAASGERIAISEELAEANVYQKLRVERTSARYIGKKTKKQLAKEEADRNPLKEKAEKE
jgi:large subunit ribosomal protein L13e